MEPIPSPKPVCRVVRAGNEFIGKQGLFYRPGVSRESCGASGIHLQWLTLPAGARAKAHLHEHHETAIYIVSGVSGMWFGDGLQEHHFAQTGDFVYIPADTPHLPYNPGMEECVALIARTDANEQESVVLLPELDALPHLTFTLPEAA